MQIGFAGTKSDSVSRKRSLIAPWRYAAKTAIFTVPLQILHGGLALQHSVPSLEIASIQ